MPGMPNSPYNNHGAPGPLPTRAPPNPPQEGNHEAPPGPVTEGKNQEFVKKVKEIERRIIQHLHQRGYDESHPDYHRYLAKAKELAIQKAGKEREKIIAAQRQMRATGRYPATHPEEYHAYMRFREQQQQSHAANEQQRKMRLAKEAQDRQEVLRICTF